MRPFWKKMLSCAMAFVCLTGAAAGLTGCHGSKEKAAFEVPESFDTTKQYEITFWAKNDTNIRQTDIYKKTIADFEALYPNITVNLKLYTDYGKIYNDVITNIATQTTPNVCITYPDHIATYLTGSQVVVPLDELMADPAYGRRKQSGIRFPDAGGSNSAVFEGMFLKRTLLRASLHAFDRSLLYQPGLCGAAGLYGS